MKSDTVTVSLFAMHTAEGLAQACHAHAENVFHSCPVGWYFACPLVRLGNGRCGKITAKDWESVMVEVQDDSQ
jgi:hypothetical protein